MVLAAQMISDLFGNPFHSVDFTYFSYHIQYDITSLNTPYTPYTPYFDISCSPMDTFSPNERRSNKVITSHLISDPLIGGKHFPLHTLPGDILPTNQRRLNNVVTSHLISHPLIGGKHFSRTISLTHRRRRNSRADLRISFASGQLERAVVI
jgi:hypothetical protein